MKNMKYLLAFSGLVFGSLIFSSSLIMASQGEVSNSIRVSEKRFYISGPILPDNIIYPGLMIVDKAILSISLGDQIVYTKIEFADDRFRSAKLLLKRDQEELAFTTITKSQKYLITAAHHVFSDPEISDKVVSDLVLALQKNSKELLDCKKDFKHQDTTLIDELIEESDVLIGQLMVFKS